MVKPLTFKGDKRSKKRKRKDDHDEQQQQHDSSEKNQALMRPDNAHTVDDDDSWVTADVPADIAGPIIIALPSEEPTCLACDANGKVFASPIENIVDRDLATAEPHDVRQVWVANRVAGTEGFSFKGHHGRYLSCDKVGLLSATREAISAEESFRCIPTPDTPGTFSIQTERETYLGISDATSTTVEVRGDATSIEYTTTLRIRMQARFKPRLKASKAEKAREKISRKELEEAVGRRLDEDEIKRLKRARREGNYHEAILDVRVKGKHDKFAS